MVAQSWFNIHENFDKAVGFLLMGQVVLWVVWRIVTSFPNASLVFLEGSIGVERMLIPSSSCCLNLAGSLTFACCFLGAQNSSGMGVGEECFSALWFLKSFPLGKRKKKNNTPLCCYFHSLQKCSSDQKCSFCIKIDP